MARFEIDLNKRNLGRTLNIAQYIRYCERTGTYIIWTGDKFISEIDENTGNVIKNHPLSKQTKKYAQMCVDKLLETLSQKEER